MRSENRMRIAMTQREEAGKVVLRNFRKRGARRGRRGCGFIQLTWHRKWSACWRRRGNSGDLRNPLNRDEGPVGTIVEFVAEFVNRLFEYEGIKQNLQLVAAFRHDRAAAGGFQIAAQERPRTPGLPKSRPRLHGSKIRLAKRPTLDLVGHLGERGISERSQH